MIQNKKINFLLFLLDLLIFTALIQCSAQDKEQSTRRPTSEDNHNENSSEEENKFNQQKEELRTSVQLKIETNNQTFTGIEVYLQTIDSKWKMVANVGPIEIKNNLLNLSKLAVEDEEIHPNGCFYLRLMQNKVASPPSAVKCSERESRK